MTSLTIFDTSFWQRDICGNTSKRMGFGTEKLYRVLGAIVVLNLVVFAIYMNVYTHYVDIWSRQTLGLEDHGLSAFSKYYQDDVVQKCGYLIEKFPSWLLMSKYKEPFISVSTDHGLGDRLGGVATGILYALEHSSPYQINWPGLNSVFDFPPFFHRSSRFILGTDERSTCMQQWKIPNGLNCVSVLSHRPPKCWSKNPFSVRGQRMCVSENICRMAKEFNNVSFPDMEAVSPAQTVGCAMRLMLNPHDEFLSRKFDWYVRGETVSMTVSDMRALLKQFATTSIQLRTGDKSFTGNAQESTRAALKLANQSLTCSDKVFEEQGFVEKERVIVFSSDSEPLREYMRANHGNNLVMLLAKPSHVDTSSFHEKDRVIDPDLERMSTEERLSQTTFAEWLILGSANDVILGSLFSTHRVSWFPYTSLLYNLKAYAYEASTCERRNVRNLGGAKGLDMNKQYYHAACNASLENTTTFESFHRLT